MTEAADPETLCEPGSQPDIMSGFTALDEYMDQILVRGARTHNLKNIDLELPRDQLIVITGLSGSGKSSLAFDTIYAEGQRRYVESLSAYARQFLSMMEKPDVDHIDGLSPAISIEQKSTSHNPRSTVGTVTEIKKSHTLGREKRYYAIELLNERETVVMVPVGAEEKIGLRRPISEAKLRRVWRILKDDPKQLPGNYGKRCELLDEKLESPIVLAPVGSQRASVRDLLTHRTGLPRHDLSWYNSDATRSELVQRHITGKIFDEVGLRLAHQHCIRWSWRLRDATRRISGHHLG